MKAIIKVFSNPNTGKFEKEFTDTSETIGLIPTSIAKKGKQGIGENFYKTSDVKHKRTFKSEDDWNRNGSEWKSNLEKKDKIKYSVVHLAKRSDHGGKTDYWIYYGEN